MESNSDKRQKFRNKRRLEIISAASRVLSDKGVNGFTVKDVSESMGIGRGTLYEHIKTKNDILYIIMEDALIKAAQVLREEVGLAGPPIFKLMAAIKAHIRTIRQHSVVVLILYQDATPLEKHQFRRVRELIDDYHLIFQEILEEGREQGVFYFEDGRLLAHSITAILNTWLIKKNFLRQQMSFEKYRTIIGRLVIQGLLDLSSPDLAENLNQFQEVLAAQ